MGKANILMYKGYYTKITYDHDAKVMTGIIEDINDLVYFESKNADEIESEFRNAVDHYLEYCKENNIEPDKVYKGSFNVRVESDLHRKLAHFALSNEKSLNSVVEDAIREYLAVGQLLNLVNAETTFIQHSPHVNTENIVDLETWKKSIVSSNYASSSTPTCPTN